MKRHNFKAHQIVLTDALRHTIQQHVETHGRSFSAKDLEHMSVSLDQVASEALMFAGDCWPQREEHASNDNVVALFPAANVTPTRKCFFGLCRIGVMLKALNLRFRLSLRIKLFTLLPIADNLHNKLTHIICHAQSLTG